MTKIKFKGNIGCEFECCMSRHSHDLPKSLVPKGWIVSSDASVHSNKRNYSCELKTSKYPITTKKIKQLLKDFEKVSKEIKEVNRSCGLHIHISFKKLPDYYKLFSWDFVNKFQDFIFANFKTAVEKARPFNSYCSFYGSKKDFLQATNGAITSHSRNYRNYSVNFNSYNIFKTIEFRVFPGVKTVAKFKKYLTMLLNFINDYLQSKELKQTKAELEKVEKPKLITNNFEEKMTKSKPVKTNFVEHVNDSSSPRVKEVQITSYLNKLGEEVEYK